MNLSFAYSWQQQEFPGMIISSGRCTACRASGKHVIHGSFGAAAFHYVYCLAKVIRVPISAQSLELYSPP